MLTVEQPEDDYGLSFLACTSPPRLPGPATMSGAVAELGRWRPGTHWKAALAGGEPYRACLPSVHQQCLIPNQVQSGDDSLEEVEAEEDPEPGFRHCPTCLEKPTYERPGSASTASGTRCVRTNEKKRPAKK